MKMKMNFLRKVMSTFFMGIFLLSTCVPATLAEEIVHFYHNDHLGSPLAMTDENGNVAHKDWGRVNWTTYNTANGESRPACGDVDGDGKAEIVVGLGQGGGGYLEVFDDASSGYGHLNWFRVH